MRLLNINEHKFGGWLQTPHPTKSTHEIIRWVGSKVSIANMYVIPKSTQKYTYTSIQKPPAS